MIVEVVLSGAVTEWGEHRLTIDLAPDDWWSEIVYGGLAFVTVQRGSNDRVRRVLIEFKPDED